MINGSNDWKNMSGEVPMIRGVGEAGNPEGVGSLQPRVASLRATLGKDANEQSSYIR